MAGKRAEHSSDTKKKPKSPKTRVQTTTPRKKVSPADVEVGSWVIEPRRPDPAATIQEALLALQRAEDAVLQALRSRFPLNSACTVTLPGHKMRFRAVVLDYTATGCVKVLLLGARAVTKTKTAEIPALEIAHEDAE